MSARILHAVPLAFAAVALAAGCAHELSGVRVVDTCGASGEMYVSSFSDTEGREITVQRVLPVTGNCEDIIVTRLRYDRHGALVRQTNEHSRCGVLESSTTALRSDRGWTIERSRNVDHDEHMDERSVSFSPASEHEPLELGDPQLACAQRNHERPDDSRPVVARR